MDERVKKLWVDALRSGLYQQGRDQLRIVGADGKPKDCCLGVLCELYRLEHPKQAKWDGAYRTFDTPTALLFVVEYDDQAETSETKLPLAVAEWAGLGLHTNPDLGGKHGEASEWNDNGASFAEIANRVEERL